MIIEIGGTVGDIESLPFLEAIRQFRRKQAAATRSTCTSRSSRTSKQPTSSRPSRRSTRSRTAPDRYPARHPSLPFGARPPTELKKKIALFCNVEDESVIPAYDVDYIYQVPFAFSGEGLDEILLDKGHLPHEEIGSLTKWEEIVKRGKMRKRKRA